MNASFWLGILLVAWGAFLAAGARPLHERARELVQWMRSRGQDPRHILGVSYVASREGLRGLRVVGAIVGVVGIALIVLGILRRP